MSLKKKSRFGEQGSLSRVAVEQKGKKSLFRDREFLAERGKKVGLWEEEKFREPVG